MIEEDLEIDNKVAALGFTHAVFAAVGCIGGGVIGAVQTVFFGSTKEDYDASLGSEVAGAAGAGAIYLWAAGMNGDPSLHGGAMAVGLVACHQGVGRLLVYK